MAKKSSKRNAPVQAPGEKRSTPGGAKPVKAREIPPKRKDSGKK
jgi:hypothetical protein